MKLEEAYKTNPHAILVHSGVLFDVFNPIAENLRIIDMAHGLSNLCRYGGHSPKFYSVAQHSVMCSHYTGTPQEQLEFLMHDTSEAYLIDLPRPIKRKLIEYIKIEDNLLEVIFNHFKLTFPLTDKVHQVDDAMLHYEYNAFYTNIDDSFEFWTPEYAKSQFLARYNELRILIEQAA